MPQHPWFPVQPDMGDIRDCDSRFFQTITHRLIGKPTVVFNAGKALFFGGGDDRTVANQGRRGVT